MTHMSLPSAQYQGLVEALRRGWEALNTGGLESPLVAIATLVAQQNSPTEPKLQANFWQTAVGPATVSRIAAVVMWTGEPAGQYVYQRLSSLGHPSRDEVREELPQILGEEAFVALLKKLLPVYRQQCLKETQGVPSLDRCEGCEESCVTPPLEQQWLLYITLEWLLSSAGQAFYAAALAKAL